MSDELKVERRGRVLVVTIDRQERMNALSQQVYDDLLETWTSLKDDRTIRSIVITGAGIARVLHRHGPAGIRRAGRTAAGRRPTCTRSCGSRRSIATCGSRRSWP